jgi:hypothetical protein
MGSFSRANFDSVYFKHACARDIKRMMGDTYESYFKFSLVRNPWDWVVSNYARNRRLHHCYVIGTPYGFDSRTPGRVPDCAKGMSFERWWLERFRPSKIALLTDATGSLLVDGVYRFESIDQAVGSIRRRLNVEFVPPRVDTRGERTSADYRDYYTEETRRLVAEHFREEIERFRYSFG